MASRRSHHSKNLEERQQYWRTVIRAPSPTLEDTSPIIDTTDTAATAAKKEKISALSTTSPPSRFSLFLRERAVEIIVISLFVPLFLWIGYQLYSLNREVGELRANLDDTKTAYSKLESKVDNTEKKLGDRIDRLYDQQLHAPTRSK